MSCGHQWKAWTRFRDVRRALEYGKTTKTADIVKYLCSTENYTQKYQFIGFISETKPVNWAKDSQKFHIYINEEGMYELLFSSQKPKAKWFRNHGCNLLFPHILQQLTHKLHVMKIEKHRQSLEEKEQEINDLITNRHVARRRNFDNVLCFIKKISEEAHPYYVIWCRYKQLKKHKRWLRLRYSWMEVVDECHDPNAIDRWCRFKREIIKKPNYCKNHFSLTEEKQAVLETALDVNV